MAEVGERRLPLSRDRIVQAALAVADNGGIDAVTLRRVAERLDVHPTSIYNHLPNKEAILDALVDRLMEEADLPGSYPDWRDWVRAFASALRRLARAHPGAFMVFTKRPAVGPVASRQTEGALDAFRRAGFSPVQARRAAAGTALALLGLALNECPPIGPWAEPDLTHRARNAFPRLNELVAVDEDTDALWDLVIESLITGLTTYIGTRP